jgi:eukaryotic-like serine/threonine-protein kinase
MVPSKLREACPSTRSAEGVPIPTAQPGQMLSHYRLVQKIGEGGMGVVWKALDTKLDRHIALKVLRPELTADPERRRRFLREARTTAATTHPNIVTVHEIDEVDDVTFIIMELVEGRTLRSVIDGHPMPIPEALRIATEIAEGLTRAHQAHIVHRDLKPDNVIVGADGHPRILDFGLAKLIEHQQEALRSQLSQEKTRSIEITGEGTILGTVAYMSPEQARGDVIDARSDIFSFGVVLYEMVTGRVPFPGHNRIETMAAILHKPAVAASRLNADVPSPLEDILGKCLEKNPGGRYQNSQDLVVDLRRLGRELEAGSMPSYGEIRGASTLARKSWRLALLGGAVVILVGALIVLRPDRQVPAPAKPAHARSEIAVLPFQNLSVDEPHAYFASGLHDELLTQLAKVAALKVISRTSVMGYQGTSKPLRQIADELGVGSVVEGSVQVVGERLRVNVQLIDAATDEHLWAEGYDRSLDDAFAIQSEVAQQIVAAVGAALTRAEQGSLTAPPTANAEAYRFYLQGNEYLTRPYYSREDLEIAQQLYERALALDPDFALAHAALSRIHGGMYFLRFDPSEARAARQREEAEAALRLAPDLPQAHIAMGAVHAWARRDYRRALQEYTIALEGLPNDATLWRMVADVHRRLGNWDKVSEAFEKATQLNPRYALLFSDIGTTYYRLHRYADAVSEYDRALSLAPDMHWAAVSRGWVYFEWQGQLDSLRATLNRVPRDAGTAGTQYFAIWRADLLLMERNPGSLLEMLPITGLDVFEAQWCFLPTALYAAWAHQLRGDHAAARAAFDSALVRLDSALKDLPDDWRVHAARGLALAGLGHRDEARQEARWLQGSVIYREDAFSGSDLARNRASIFAQVGDAGAALDEIERLLAGPSEFGVHALQLDPIWDPIREHPRFKALIAKYSSSETR